MTRTGAPVMSGLAELTASGTPRELGRAHGAGARQLIHEVYEIRMGRAGRSHSEADVLERAGRYLPFVRRYVPELLDEVEGLAEGAGLTVERAFFLQVATELEREAESGPGDGCSSVGAAGGADGSFIGQNWDQPHSSRGHQIMLRLRPNDGPELLMFTWAGVIGYIGMNGWGLGHVNNQLYADTKPLGLTGYFITRRMLAFRTVPEALTWLEDVEIGSTASYLLGDAAGNIVDIELGGGTFKRLVRPIQGHTNHYIAAGWDLEDRVDAHLPDSSARLDRLRSVFERRGSEHSAMEVLRDHEGYPASVCRHEAGDGLTTAASIVMRLSHRELLVAYGRPCETPYRAYSVASGDGAILVPG